MTLRLRAASLDPRKGDKYSRNTPANADVPIDRPGAEGKQGDSQRQRISNATWGGIRFNAEGKLGKHSYRVLVNNGHDFNDPVTGRRRGWGKRHMDGHNAEIQKNTIYPNWEELTSGFLNHIKGIKDFSKSNVAHYSPHSGRIIMIWADSGFKVPAVFVFDLRPLEAERKDQQFYSLVSAYANNRWDSNPPNDGRRHVPDLYGRSATAQNVLTSLRPDLAEQYIRKGDKDLKYSRSVTLTPEDQTSVDIINKQTGVRDSNESLWSRVSKSFYVDDDFRARVRKAIFDRYYRIEQLEKLTKKAIGALRELAAYGAHAAALRAEKAGALTAATMQFGQIKLIDGVPIVEKIGLRNKASVAVDVGPGGEMIYEDIEVADLYDLDDENTGFLPILYPISTPSNNLLRAYWAYTFAKRGTRLDDSGRPVPLDRADMKRALSLAKKFPEIGIVHANMQKWNDGLVQFLIDSQVLDENTGNIWREYKDYIPFYLNLFGEGNDRIGGVLKKRLGSRDFTLLNSLVGQKPAKRFRGIKKGELMEPVEAISRNANAAIESGLRNIAAQKTLKLATDYEGWARQDDEATGPGSVTIREFGKDVKYMVEDPLLYETIANVLDGDSPVTSSIEKKFGAPARWLREAVTRSPEFMMANMLRDSLHVWALMGGDFVPVKDSFSQLYKNIRGSDVGTTDDTYKILKTMGVSGGGYDPGGLNKRKIRRLYAKSDSSYNPMDALWKVWDKSGDISAMSEASTRQRVYSSSYARLISKGYTERQAMVQAGFEAQEVLNFSRRGSNIWIRVISATVPFVNARLQGLDKMYQSLRGEGSVVGMDKDAAMRMLALRAGIISSMTMAYTLLWWDDEEYENMRPELRDDYWHIPLGTSGYRMQIPIPFEAGILFKTVPEHITRALLGQSGRETARALQHAIWSTMSFNPIPQAIKPILESVTNHNFWTGRPIVPFYEKSLVGGEGGSPYTTAQSKILGSALGVNPRHFDNIVRGYTGAMGSWSMSILDAAIRSTGIGDFPSKPTPRLTDMPFFKRFMGNEFGGGAKDAFYDWRGVAEGTWKTVLDKQGKDPIGAAEYASENRMILSYIPLIRSVNKQLKDIRDHRNYVMYSDMPSSQKREMVDNLERMENSILKNVPSIARVSGAPAEWLKVLSPF